MPFIHLIQLTLNSSAIPFVVTKYLMASIGEDKESTCLEVSSRAIALTSLVVMYLADTFL